METKNNNIKWVIEKEIMLHGRRVKAAVPNPEVPRELAFKRFKELLKDAVRQTAS